MKLKKSLIAGLLVLSTQAAQAYNVVDRFKMVDDKLKTETMLRPIGHDFIFDISAALNSDAQTFVSDISDASKAGTLTAAQNVLNKYNNTEQTIKLNLNLGIPIFSFTAWDVKVQPNFRIMQLRQNYYKFMMGKQRELIYLVTVLLTLQRQQKPMLSV
jgi:hypothetical protein